MAMRFQPLIATTANVSATTSVSLKCFEVAANSSSEMPCPATVVRASVQASAASDGE